MTAGGLGAWEEDGGNWKDSGSKTSRSGALAFQKSRLSDHMWALRERERETERDTETQRERERKNGIQSQRERTRETERGRQRDFHLSTAAAFVTYHCCSTCDGIFVLSSLST